MTTKPRRRRGGGRVTLNDVAKVAGVTAMTVSRALNRPETVSHANRAKVQAAVSRLNYVPDRFAGALASQRTRIVTVIVPRLSRPVFNEIVGGAHDVIGPAGYQILLSATFASLEEEEAICRAVLGWRPEGVIMSGVDHTDATRGMLRDSGIPVVEALELGEAPIDINIGCDHFAVGATMADYLIGKGYRKPGFIGGELTMDFRARRRYDGFVHGLAAHGMTPAHAEIFEEPNTYDAGSRAVQRLLESGNEVDAVFCANDDLGVGAMCECLRLGLRVPQDIAVAGFAGLAIGRTVHPTLTTIASPRRRMGELAAQAILDRTNGTLEGGMQIDVGFELVEREST